MMIGNNSSGLCSGQKECMVQGLRGDRYINIAQYQTPHQTSGLAAKWKTDSTVKAQQA
jgi:hypothetical protein